MKTTFAIATLLACGGLSAAGGVLLAVATQPAPAQPAPAPVYEVPPGNPFGNNIELKRRSVSWIGPMEVRSYELPPWARLPEIPPQPMLPPPVDLSVPMPPNLIP